jgi:hypothetical protein
MSEATAQQWCRMFFSMKSEVTSWSSIVSDDLVQSSGEKKNLKELQNFCVNFHKFHACFVRDYHS